MSFSFWHCKIKVNGQVLPIAVFGLKILVFPPKFKYVRKIIHSKSRNWTFLPIDNVWLDASVRVVWNFFVLRMQLKKYDSSERTKFRFFEKGCVFPKTFFDFCQCRSFCPLMDSSQTDVKVKNVQCKICRTSNLRGKFALSTKFDSWFTYCVLSQQKSVPVEFLFWTFWLRIFSVGESKIAFSWQIWFKFTSVVSLVIKMSNKFSWSINILQNFLICAKAAKELKKHWTPFTTLLLRIPSSAKTLKGFPLEHLNLPSSLQARKSWSFWFCWMLMLTFVKLLGSFLSSGSHSTVSDLRRTSREKNHFFVCTRILRGRKCK